MGMPITLTLVKVDDDTGVDLIKQSFDYFRYVDRVFSTYKPDSQISLINSGELSPADALPVVREVLELCAQMKSATDGYFDITRKGQIDPSGLVKGWAIYNAAKMLDEAGVQNYCIEAGGDLQVKGLNEAGKPWRVGIRNPSNKSEIVKVLELSGGAVATSGNYERGEHIYNPHTGRAATQLLSLSVIGPNIYEADVYATAAFAMNEAGPGFIASLGLECYALERGGEAVLTPGLREYEAKDDQ